MRAIGLEYHDVVANGDVGATGFQGAGPDRYKLELDQFRQQMAHLSARGNYVVCLANQLPGDLTLTPVFITFDDGGVSALTLVAKVMQQYGFQGHFFVTTKYIGSPGFLSADQIRELDQMGHAIGTHSSTHPSQMAYCSREQLLQEWSESRDVLSAVLGKEISLGSVPGGFYARHVAETAAESGLRILFNSEPVSKSAEVDGCLILGRFTISRYTSNRHVVRLVSPRPFARWQQYVLWNAKKIAKFVAGSRYPEIRRRLLGHR